MATFLGEGGAAQGGVAIGIEGAQELMKVLKALPEELQKKALDACARAGAQELQRAAYAQLALAMRSRTPRAEDIIIKKARPKHLLQSEYKVGPPRSRPWLRWLHDGTAPHLISATERYGTRRASGRNTFLGVRKGGTFLADTFHDKFFGRVVKHPGQKAQPWLQAAQFQSEQAVYAAMADVMRKALRTQARRLSSSKYSKALVKRFLR